MKDKLNILTSVMGLCEYYGWDYQIEGTGVGYENRLTIFDDKYGYETSVYFDDETGEEMPEMISWTELATSYQTPDYEIIKKIILKKMGLDLAD